MVEKCNRRLDEELLLEGKLLIWSKIEKIYRKKEIVKEINL